VSLTDWWLYRKCQVCHQPTGKPCLSRSGYINAHPMLVPHKTRKRRTLKGRAAKTPQA
jgi:hypothetical protein